MDREVALKILDDVRQSYDKIAEDFSRTRYSIWKEFKPLGQYAKDGDKILDLGCGNGRLIELFQGKNIEYAGIDNSEKLIEIAHQKYPVPLRTAGTKEKKMKIVTRDLVAPSELLHPCPRTFSIPVLAACLSRGQCIFS